MRLVLLAADVIGLTVAFQVASRLFPGGHQVDRVAPTSEFVLFIATLPVWAILIKAHRLYDGDQERADHSTADDLIGVFHVVTAGTFIVMLAGWVSQRFDPTPPKLFAFWGTAIVGMTAARAAARILVRRLPSYVQRTIIVGAGDAGQMVARKICAHPDYGLELVSFVDGRPRSLDPRLVHVPVYHSLQALPQLISRLDCRRVILAYSDTTDEDCLELATQIRALGVYVDIVPRLYEALGSQSELHSIEGLQLLALPPLALPQSSRWKRVIDITAAASMLVVLSPLLALIAMGVRLNAPGSVIYRSERVGAAGKRFTLFKFRTMRSDADDLLEALLADVQRQDEFRTAHKLKNDPRVTSFGRWLRRLSLDELPQLVNVLRGELSLVGPRPITLREFEQYTATESPRATLWDGVPGYWALGVRPGITGLWQINGRSAIDFDERVRLDKLYAMNWSLRLDFEILAKTLRSVTSTRGAY